MSKKLVPSGTFNTNRGRQSVAGPGVFYGEDGAGYVRIALTASDEDIAKAAERLMASAG